MTTNQKTDSPLDLRKTQELPPRETAPKTAPYAPMRRKFIAAIILQLAVLATMFSMPAYTLATGETVFLKTRLYDPWDMFRGQYITLKYDGASSAIPAPPGLHWGQTVYVALRKGGKHAVAEKVYSAMPNVDRKKYAVIRGKVHQVGDGCVDVTYGIERYYIPERTGDRFSNARGPLLAEVAVDNFGNCVLKKVVAGDKR
jgi:uncharacterized membrane-anchored protein